MIYIGDGSIIYRSDQAARKLESVRSATVPIIRFVTQPRALEDVATIRATRRGRRRRLWRRYVIAEKEQNLAPDFEWGCSPLGRIFTKLEKLDGYWK